MLQKHSIYNGNEKTNPYNLVSKKEKNSLKKKWRPKAERTCISRRVNLQNCSVSPYD